MRGKRLPVLLFTILLCLQLLFPAAALAAEAPLTAPAPAQTAAASAETTVPASTTAPQTAPSAASAGETTASAPAGTTVAETTTTAETTVSAETTAPAGTADPQLGTAALDPSGDFYALRQQVAQELAADQAHNAAGTVGAQSYTGAETRLGRAFQAILAQVQAGAASMDLTSYDITRDEALTLAWETSRRCYRLNSTGAGASVFYRLDNDMAVSMRFSYYSDAVVQRLDAVFARVQARMDPAMSDLDKALFLHDYLVSNVAYSMDGGTADAYDCYNTVGALLNGKAVCQGYAVAYCQLLEQAGIESAVVSSTANNHAWNMVKLDGVWYQADCTWDDPLSNGDVLGRAFHSLFLISTAAMTAEHTYGDWVAFDDAFHSLVTADSCASDGSSALQNAWWQNVCSPAGYWQGDWYYVRANTLYRRTGAAVSGSERLQRTGAGRMAMYGDTLYLLNNAAGTSATLLVCDTDNNVAATRPLACQGIAVQNGVLKADMGSAGIVTLAQLENFTGLQLPADDSGERTLAAGAAATLTVQLAGSGLMPAYAYAVHWTSSADCITLTPNGLTASILAVSDGSAAVTASCQNKSVTFQVQVTSKVPTRVELALAGQTASAGTVVLDTSVTPVGSVLAVNARTWFEEDGALQELTPDLIFTSSDPAVFTVDAAGRVTLRGEGEAALTAAARTAGENGTAASANILLRVHNYRPRLSADSASFNAAWKSDPASRLALCAAYDSEITSVDPALYTKNAGGYAASGSSFAASWSGGTLQLTSLDSEGQPRAAAGTYYLLVTAAVGTASHRYYLPLTLRAAASWPKCAVSWPQKINAFYRGSTGAGQLRLAGTVLPAAASLQAADGSASPVALTALSGGLWQAQLDEAGAYTARSLPGSSARLCLTFADYYGQCTQPVSLPLVWTVPVLRLSAGTGIACNYGGTAGKATVRLLDRSGAPAPVRTLNILSGSGTAALSEDGSSISFSAAGNTVFALEAVGSDWRAAVPLRFALTVRQTIPTWTVDVKALKLLLYGSSHTLTAAAALDGAADGLTMSAAGSCADRTGQKLFDWTLDAAGLHVQWNDGYTGAVPGTCRFTVTPQLNGLSQPAALAAKTLTLQISRALPRVTLSETAANFTAGIGGESAAVRLLSSDENYALVPLQTSFDLVSKPGNAPADAVSGAVDSGGAVDVRCGAQAPAGTYVLRLPVGVQNAAGSVQKVAVLTYTVRVAAKAAVSAGAAGRLDASARSVPVTVTLRVRDNTTGIRAAAIADAVYTAPGTGWTARTGELFCIEDGSLTAADRTTATLRLRLDPAAVLKLQRYSLPLRITLGDGQQLETQVTLTLVQTAPRLQLRERSVTLSRSAAGMTASTQAVRLNSGDALAAGSWSSGRWDDCFSVTAAADGTITVSLTDAGRAALSPGSYVLRLAYQPLAGTFAERFSGGVWTRQAQGVTVLPLSVKVTA